MNKIILGDNQAIFRAGVAKMLATEDDCRVIAQCSENAQLYELILRFPGAQVIFAAALKPDLPLLAARLESAKSRAIVILENGQQSEPFQIPAIYGCVYRTSTGSKLIDSVRRVALGERLQEEPEVFSEPLEEDQVGARVRDRLTPKEMQIVALLVQGNRNKEIALRLHTTEQVIKNYLRGIFDKTGVDDRLELALFTIHHRTLATAATAAAERIPQCA
jgi:DNA-binding NarL/FixJ family response regulator